MTERQATRLHDLELQHRGLDTELEALMRRAYLTPGEQETARTLKKRKLDAKDRIAALRRMLGS
ncbi:MAG TPA: YdcH family protein [Polyangiaceae bacterium]|nr:YdcH family protein [Polyangiaceae bacterium]